MYKRQLQGETIPADPNVKNFSYAVVDGDVYFRENSIMRKADLSATATGRIKGMVELRTIVQELIDYQLNDYPEDAIAQKQRELNVAYDRFADQYGLINSRANAQAFRKIHLIICSALWKMWMKTAGWNPRQICSPNGRFDRNGLLPA